MADDYETADKFAQGRAIMAPFLGLLVLLMQQGIFFAWDWGSDSLLQILVWMGFAVLMLLLLLTGGGWFLSKRARGLANDEVTRANRQRGITIGFVVAMVTGFLVWAVSPFEPLHAQRAANLIVSMGLGCAFVAYGIAELVATHARDA
ncbi:hypothetical protein [Arenimonas sp.]|uniref:hypothetical protein n=1 Tax=Arenimonas sp. TaxID=1872635 RepID=UPI0035B0CFFF